MIPGLIILYGCLEPFEPNVPNSDDIFLVIDGVITDKPGPYEVIISKSSSLGDVNESVSGVIEILIESSNGTSENLTEISEGVYATNELQGRSGESYRLRFTFNNQEYQSSWETITSSAVIDSLYYSLENVETTNPDMPLEGLQFFIDNHSDGSQKKFFRYEWEETWKFTSFWPSALEYAGDDIAEVAENQVHTCWKSINSTQINLSSTAGLVESILIRHSLDLFTGLDDRFTLRYSLLAKQYELDETEFLFWKALREISQESGSLFDKQPAKITGNLINITNPEKIVLGYFSASGLQEKRIYVDNEEVTNTLNMRTPCFPLDSIYKSTFSDINGYEKNIADKISAGAFFFSFIPALSSPIPLGVTLSTAVCSDCRLNGGSLNKPEFWNE